ncbi:MAG: histidine utilization repressor [Rhodospirillales bacterium]|nr:histidine utilization repressor [Rhodospirillales bacterium]
MTKPESAQAGTTATQAGPQSGKSKKRTLHDRILRDFETCILSGDWPPGYRIPFEVDLARQYNCSRMTVNKALTQLVSAGLIERRRRSGSRVAQPRAQSAILEIRDIESEVLALGLPYAYRLVGRSVRKCNGGDRARLDVPAGSSILELSCLHLAASRPFCIEQRIISLLAVPEAREESFETIAPGQWLLRKVPWSSAEHTIRAIAADDDTAERLELPVGAPCLVIERRTSGAGTSITHVRLTYPGESHELVARFTPSDLPPRPPSAAS